MVKQQEIFFRFEDGKRQKVLLDKRKDMLAFFRRMQEITNKKIYISV